MSLVPLLVWAAAVAYLSYIMVTFKLWMELSDGAMWGCIVWIATVMLPPALLISYSIG